MPFCKGYQFLVIAHCDLFDWVKAKLLRTFFSQTVADFLWEDVICHYGCFGKLVIHVRSENKDAIVELAERSRERKIVVFTYHPQANGMIERSHKPIIDTVSKKFVRGPTN